ncbi:MAG: prolipoprotein diacylglyceryl transferase [Polyangiales bacterium]
MHPILVEIPTPWGELPLYSYGVMLGLSLVVAWYFIMWWGHKKEKLDKELMANTFIVTAISAIVISRLFYIFTNLDKFDTIGEWFAFRQGGLVAYGGFIGGFLGAWAYLRSKGVPLLAWADIVVPTLGTGLMFTRVGCYLYGCDFGRPLGDDAPGWLQSLGTFPKWDVDASGFVCSDALNGSPAWALHTEKYDIGLDAAASLPVHPTQVYESLAGLTLFGITMLVWQRRKFRGQVLCVAVVAYGVWRFLIEYVRDDPERGSAFGFSTSQLISMLLVPLAGVAYMTLQKRAREKGESKIPESALQREDGDKSAGESKSAAKSRDKKGGGDEPSATSSSGKKKSGGKKKGGGKKR